MKFFSLRLWYLLAAICCAALLGYALYSQHKMFLDPCPLCIFQRVAFMWIGVWALVGALFNPGGKWRWTVTTLMTIGAIVGGAIAWRHVWLQGLPLDQVPECGPGLAYMMDTLPFWNVLKTVLEGDGACAEVQWQFLGLSMPAWTLVWFIGLGLVTIFLTIRQARVEGRT
ncbi:disulfide bond formation protein B [Marinihelvus fidelis]|uniref:Disulfide bond formation protein B n=1 Tax=Marinihelvus fidelis TaxID=2613842 RepID=A0A5N0T9U1_9GAMM|nr:disulfide bond formation protein B [Marinihelvus fidelis]KAA9131813.1 disulfide bond formation protein B [Marinihelvus fidelis]